MLRQGLLLRPLLRAPLDRWKEQDTFLKDGFLALALTLLAFVPTLSTIGAQIGDLPERSANGLGVALVLAQTLPLAARTRRPGGCLAVVAVAFGVHQSLGFATTFGSMGLYLALYSTGAHQVRFRRALAMAAGAGYVVLAVTLHRLGSPQDVTDYLAFYLVLAGVWLVGSGVRRRREEEAQRRRLAAEVATAAERARIARELHDVVTHHVTAMVVQADAAQFLITSAPERAATAMASVSDTGRRALTELRYLLGVLEATGESTTAGPARGLLRKGLAREDLARQDRGPTLGQLEDLVEQARRSGQPVEFSESGERRPRSVDVELAAYRVVQEALTNAMKYATGQPTRVLVRHGEKRVEIGVTTDGPGPVSSPAAVPATREPGPEGGRGLAGLRARVRMLDGELEAGPRPEGGFEIRATIPSEPEPEPVRE
ncbi:MULTISPECIES: histidine kinase [unclassified Streptomyces]|uniref:sensor histidine kinase n=1 Tax=unclassified Streptomyces TaxID=2593676 RepID=UPI000F4EC2E3|nr:MULTISPECIES: histidine kinase [unclassified Streptomyces]MDH6455342.1 signal transduction histidine kinase [Streptomyces sp. SAI-119]MDH6494105.1 signal transduction histidine kinase [Streptomyces sp. SAI-149]